MAVTVSEIRQLHRWAGPGRCSHCGPIAAEFRDHVVALLRRAEPDDAPYTPQVHDLVEGADGVLYQYELDRFRRPYWETFAGHRPLLSVDDAGRCDGGYRPSPPGPLALVARAGQLAPVVVIDA